jgi:hypothetical protein
VAKSVYNPFVGQRVYAPFAPQRAGIITHVGPVITITWPGKPVYVCHGDNYVNVRWLTGEEQVNMSSSHLNDFDGLITDHQKKLATHTVTLDKLKELQRGLDANI